MCDQKIIRIVVSSLDKKSETFWPNATNVSQNISTQISQPLTELMLVLTKLTHWFDKKCVVVFGDVLDVPNSSMSKVCSYMSVCVFTGSAMSLEKHKQTIRGIKPIQTLSLWNWGCWANRIPELRCLKHCDGRRLAIYRLVWGWNCVTTPLYTNLYSRSVHFPSSAKTTTNLMFSVICHRTAASLCMNVCVCV